MNNLLNRIVVKKGVDFEWLNTAADDNETKETLKYIRELTDQAKNNVFNYNQTPLKLQLDGMTIWMRECDAWFSVIMYTESFKENEHLLIPPFDCRTADIVVDLGANYGYYCLKVARNNPQCKIIAVEPSPSTFQILEKNVQSNNLKNIILLNYAVSDNNGVLQLRQLDQASALSGKYLGEIKKEQRKWIKEEMIRTIEVPAVTLGKIIEEQNLVDIDIVKIDIEEMELDVLKASKSYLKKIRNFVIEWHTKETKDKLVGFMEENDFKLIFEENRDFGDLYFENLVI